MADENFVGREDNGDWYIIKVLDDKTYQISCNRDFPMTPGVNELLNKTIRLKDEQWDKIYRMYDELKEEKSYVSERNAKDVWRIHIKVKDKTFEFYQHENVETLQYQLFEYLMELSPIVIYLHGFAWIIIVDDAVDGPFYAGAFHFVDGADEEYEYSYDENGNMTKDLNRGNRGNQI